MSAAVSYATLKDAISRAYPTLPRQLQHIARFALERPNELALGTVAAVAGAAGVNPSALIRFANALEFGGFSEMQQVFRGHLLERSSSYRERIDQLRHSGRARDPREGVLHQFVGDAVAELGHMEENVPQAAIDAAVRLISGAGTLHVLAQRRAFPVATYLAYALGQLELRTRLHDGAGGMLATTLRSVERGDVLVVASFHAYTQEVVDAARAAHDRGVPVIAITDSALSPLKPPSAVCFELSMGAEQAFRSLVAPLCLAQVLVVSTGHQLSEAPRARGKPSARSASRSAAPASNVPRPAAGATRRTAAKA